MPAPEETKTQFIDAVRQGTHILVTVKSDPSIDQLASCIALTVMLNTLGKRATAVFSGKVPSSIEFLKPGKMLQSNTDSLQDFIISLDKSKADKLRYKVEDTMVKVYITPYQASLTDKDLVYGKGDFNVDTVIAMGAHSQAELDRAVTVHGRILHDATVLTMDTFEGATTDLGAVNWIDTSVSSLSELIARNIDAMIVDRPDALDEQVATALLAGIVAETESFGNAKTTPATMEIAGRLLAAGAKQELVATRLSGPLRTSTEESVRDVSQGRRHKGTPGDKPSFDAEGSSVKQFSEPPKLPDAADAPETPEGAITDPPLTDIFDDPKASKTGKNKKDKSQKAKDIAADEAAAVAAVEEAMSKLPSGAAPADEPPADLFADQIVDEQLNGSTQPVESAEPVEPTPVEPAAEAAPPLLDETPAAPAAAPPVEPPAAAPPLEPAPLANTPATPDDVAIENSDAPVNQIDLNAPADSPSSLPPSTPPPAGPPPARPL